MDPAPAGKVLNYTELDWRWAILLGVAIRDGLLEAVADRSRKPEEVAGELGLDERAAYVVLSANSGLSVSATTEAYQAQTTIEVYENGELVSQDTSSNGFAMVNY